MLQLVWGRKTWEWKSSFQNKLGNFPECTQSPENNSLNCFHASEITFGYRIDEHHFVNFSKNMFFLVLSWSSVPTYFLYISAIVHPHRCTYTDIPTHISVIPLSNLEKWILNSTFISDPSHSYYGQQKKSNPFSAVKWTKINPKYNYTVLLCSCI